MSSPSTGRTGPAIGACLAGLLLVLAPLAAAATSKYPPDVAARGFNGGLAGWTESSSFDGNCTAPLLCPSVTNSFQASGGADDGGFIRSAYSGVAGLMAVAGTTTAVWQSPTFTYEGVGGKRPTAVDFKLDRRASVDQLLAVEGNSADYSVRLVDLSEGGESLTLFSPTTLAGAHTWTRFVRRPSVDPDLLAMGHEYLVQITTRYTTGTSAVVSGSADYDNVVLSAERGGSGAQGITSAQLSELIRAASPDTAILTGSGKAGAGKAKRFLVRVRCPRKVGRTCRMAVQGLLKRGKPATTRRTVKVHKGRAKLVTLRVKPKARVKVAKRKRLLVRQRVRAGRVTATVVKSRKLIRRH
jgi:hypothetical protein